MLDRQGLALVVVDDAGTPVASNDVALRPPSGLEQRGPALVTLDWLTAALRLPDGALAVTGDETRNVTIRVAAEVALLCLDASISPVPGPEPRFALIFSWNESSSGYGVSAGEARLHALLEHTTDIITVLEADGTVRYSNPAAGLLTRISGSEANGTQAFDLVHPDDQTTALVAFEDALLRSTPVGPVELRIRFGDGSWHLAEVFVDNLLDNPSVGGLVVTIRDITERVRHEEDIRRRERWMRSLVENLHDVVVVLDRSLRVQYATPSIERLIDAPAYTNIGESAFNDIHPDDVDHVGASIDRLRSQAGASERMEFRLRHARHGWRWVEAITVNLLDDPDVDGLVVTIRDVDDKHAADERLRDAYTRQRDDADRLRDVDKLKDEFLATVSHELRTPLTSIAGLTELLLNDHGRLPAAESHHVLERISANATEMTSMVERVLDYSRLQAGRVELRIEPLDLSAVVASLVDRMAETLKGHVVAIAVPPLAVRADAGALTTVLRNLLLNASKYSPAGTRIEIGARANGDEVVVWVRDQGIGIAPADQSKIFQHFYQAGPYHRGVGIGLNIARRYTQLNHGRLWLESSPGDGSTFYFMLPARSRE